MITDYPIDTASSLAQCEALLSQHGAAYLAAVVDVNLPDAPDGQAIDLVITLNVPTLVLTGMIDEKLHDYFSSRPLVDYVVKQNPGSIEIVQKGVKRLLANRRRKVLIVDDSTSFRLFIRTIVEKQRIVVLEARNGQEALTLMQAHPDIALVITDYEMPDMDGVQLTATLRGQHSASDLAIMGFSGSEDAFLGVRFLKAGADDLVRKPFMVEEFVSRINSRLDHIEDIRTIRDQAHRDYLTRLYNRRYLFEAGNTLYNSAMRGHIALAVGMVDIDHFKRINDTYGHDVGDQAIVALARTLDHTFRSTDLVARMGGEEFCVLTVNAADPAALFERLRQAIEAMEIPLPGGGVLKMTGSVGFSCQLGDCLEDLINQADKALYEAKSSGRNRVMQYESSAAK